MSNNYKDSIVSKMAYNIDWIIPTLRKPSKLWQVASSFTVAAVGLFTKIIIGMIFLLGLKFYYWVCSN